MFNAKLLANLSRRVYNLVREYFQEELELESLYKLHKRMAELAGIHEEVYDCCVNTCVAYTRELQNATHCPNKSCKEPRYDSQGRSRCTFSHLPIEPRFVVMYKNPDEAARLSTRANWVHTPGEYSDVWDGQNYIHRLSERVVIDGIDAGHLFFSDNRDIAVGIMTDGFSVFKRQ
ncbi:hypothetical protein DL93DRAFT_2066700, partial [Clavulina sp. PMI_390]